YQVSLQRLGGRSDPLVGYPVLTFNQNLAVPTQDARSVAADIRFRDVTAGSGLESVEALPDSVAGSLERAVALAVGDYDDDETEDLFVSGHLFRGNQGRFIETTASAGVVLRDRSTAAAFGDYDNDGRVDLYVATSGQGGALFRNMGGGRFRDVAASAGLAETGPAARALFVDFDHDGDLDLLLATPAGTRAYRNNLDGTFREMAAPMGLSGGGGGPGVVPQSRGRHLRAGRAGRRAAAQGARLRRPGRRILRLRQRRLPRPRRGGQTPGLPCRRAWRVPVPQRPNQRVRGLLVDPARQPAGRPGRRRRRRRPGWRPRPHRRRLGWAAPAAP